MSMEAQLPAVQLQGIEVPVQQIYQLLHALFFQYQICSKPN